MTNKTKLGRIFECEERIEDLEEFTDVLYKRLKETSHMFLNLQSRLTELTTVVEHLSFDHKKIEAAAVQALKEAEVAKQEVEQHFDSVDSRIGENSAENVEQNKKIDSIVNHMNHSVPEHLRGK